MSFDEIEIDHSPVHELIMSFWLFIHSPSDKIIKGLDIGPDWFTQRRSEFEDIDVEELKSSNYLFYLNLLGWLCPSKETAESFLKWFSSLSAGDVYLLLEPYLDTKYNLPNDLSKQHELTSQSLQVWYEGYFKSHLKKYDLKLVMDDVKEKQQMIHNFRTAEAFLEEITGGLVIEPSLNIQYVKLFPTFHFSPFFTSFTFSDLATACYPLNIEKSMEEIETQLLVNIGKALSDERRINILKFLSEGKKTFGEVAAEMGTTKGTVHHHILFLKAAKLIRLYETGDRQSYGYYELRKNCPDIIKDLINNKLLK